MYFSSLFHTPQVIITFYIVFFLEIEFIGVRSIVFCIQLIVMSIYQHIHSPFHHFLISSYISKVLPEEYLSVFPLCGSVHVIFLSLKMYFCQSENVFILSLLLKDSFAGEF